MKNIFFIVIILIGFASCDSKIENGDLVYLSLREGDNLSLNSKNGLKCDNNDYLKFIFIYKEDGNIELKTENGQSLVLDNYYLFVKNEEPSKFKLDTLSNNLFLVSANNRYFGCNGVEVYETYQPYIKILKN